MPLNNELLWRFTDDSNTFGICPYCGNTRMILHTDSIITRYGPNSYNVIKYCKKCKMRIEEDNFKSKAF